MPVATTADLRGARAFAAALETRFFARRFFSGRVDRVMRRFAAMVPFDQPGRSMHAMASGVTDTFSATPSRITEVVGQSDEAANVRGRRALPAQVAQGRGLRR
jgi:hypothetical protein